MPHAASDMRSPTLERTARDRRLGLDGHGYGQWFSTSSMGVVLWHSIWLPPSQGIGWQISLAVSRADSGHRRTGSAHDFSPLCALPFDVLSAPPRAPDLISRDCKPQLSRQPSAFKQKCCVTISHLSRVENDRLESPMDVHHHLGVTIPPSPSKQSNPPTHLDFPPNDIRSMFHRQTSQRCLGLGSKPV